MFRKKPEKSADDFWIEYEKEIGEKVLARGLGKYIRGWKEFDDKGWNILWGLIIASSGGLRFHHFPQQSWFTALTNFGSHEAPKEKKIFIEKERIISARLNRETRWWKKLIAATPPALFVSYRDENEEEKQLLFEVDYYGKKDNSGELAEILTAPKSE